MTNSTVSTISRTQIKKMRDKLKELRDIGIWDDYWSGYDSALRMIHERIEPQKADLGRLLSNV